MTTSGVFRVIFSGNMELFDKRGFRATQLFKGSKLHDLSTPTSGEYHVLNM